MAETNRFASSALSFEGGIGRSEGCVDNIPIWANYAVISAKPVGDNEPASDYAGEKMRVDGPLCGGRSVKVDGWQGREVLE